MTDRKAKLRDLADELRERNCVDDAFVAKSFTDRLLIVDVTREGSIPVDIERELTALDLRGVDDAYGDGARSSVRGGR